ncbi:signal peptidase I [Bradyrhizobium sp. LM3.2]
MPPASRPKVKLLAEIDAYLRDKDPRVRQVSVSLGATWQVVEILRPDGESYRDIRPLVRVNVSVVAGQGDRQESGSKGYGGRAGYAEFIESKNWRDAADGALREALVNLESIPAPAGEMDVVLGAGWPGVMLHEAVGHGLEGDFNRKKTSAFAGLMGQQVAAKGVTVVDDGTIASRRGSLSIDDEGTPTNRTVLIEDGVLVGYMQDRQNARLMNMKPTGNGRRQGYAHVPMPRMTNTYMLAGDRDPAEILASVKNGVFAANFGGGQVDITSGKYVFQCTEAYKIENGKIGAPLKGAMLIGNGPTDLHRIRMIGNDLALDTGIGTCGKNGQGVPVGVGQPSLLDGTHYGGWNGRMSVEKVTVTTKRKSSGWAGQLVQLAGIVAAVFIAKGALAEPFYVPSGSMEPTLLIGDALIASKFPYGYGTSSLPIQINLPESGRVFAETPKQGDVVVFRWPGDRSQAWVKRVVGLPGDRIQLRQGQLFVNDRPAELKPDGVGAAEDDNGGSEPAYRYVETLPNGVSHLIFKMRDNGPLDNTQEVTVPAGHLFVLGDNRDNSADSRVPLRSGGVGLLPIDNLVGRADAVLGSWDLGIRGQPVWTWLSGFRMARFFTAVH